MRQTHIVSTGLNRRISSHHPRAGKTHDNRGASYSDGYEDRENESHTSSNRHQSGIAPPSGMLWLNIVHFHVQYSLTSCNLYGQSRQLSITTILRVILRDHLEIQLRPASVPVPGETWR